VMASAGSCSVIILGVPWDEHSSYLRGAAAGPAAIRGAFRSSASNLTCESGRDLGLEPTLRDAGDLDLPPGATAQAIEQAVRQQIGAGHRVLALGGDHAVSYPLVRAHRGVYAPLTIVHFDAHPDLYDEFEGDRLSHACPFARIMEEGLADRLVQVGIRTMTAHQRAQASRFGVEVVEMRAWGRDLALAVDGPTYVSLDLDVLDPAFAPGVSHHEPGGASVRDVLAVLQRLPGPIIGADIVELNPARDPSGVTAMVAAKFLKEIADRMLSTTGSERISEIALGRR
jgi:arginase